MPDSINQIYIPIVRTRDAELKGLKNLESSVLDSVLPLVELTRSRRSKHNPDGAVEISLEKISSVMQSRPSIIDVTTLDGQSNTEIHNLLSYQEGFSNWVSFVKNNFTSADIPVAHFTEPFVRSIFEDELNGLDHKFPNICVRVPSGREGALEQIYEVLAQRDRLGSTIFIVDAGFVEPPYADQATAAALRAASRVDLSKVRACAVAASSFPSSVVATNYGGDSEGEFALSEVAIFEGMNERLPELPWIYSDYATIHPIEFSGTVTNWVPRVDIPLDRSLFYHRYRRGDGGYVMAAKLAMHDARYIPLPCWASDNVEQAARGIPQGKSPSHWIAVRMNFHISRQVHFHQKK